MISPCGKLVGYGLLEVLLAVEVEQIVIATQVAAPKENIPILWGGRVALCLTPGECRVECQAVVESGSELRLKRLIVAGEAEEVLCDRCSFSKGKLERIVGAALAIDRGLVNVLRDVDSRAVIGDICDLK